MKNAYDPSVSPQEGSKSEPADGEHLDTNEAVHIGSPSCFLRWGPPYGVVKARDRQQAEETNAQDISSNGRVAHEAIHLRCASRTSQRLTISAKPTEDRVVVYQDRSCQFTMSMEGALEYSIHHCRVEYLRHRHAISIDMARQFPSQTRSDRVGVS